MVSNFKIRLYSFKWYKAIKFIIVGSKHSLVTFICHFTLLSQKISFVFMMN
jgi:hypothetical protein